jgi:hypothetical protein
MQYAARLTTPPSLKSFAATLAALALGAAVAIGAYTLIDDESVIREPARVIVVETPAPGVASGSTGVELRGSKASATSSTPTDADTALRTDPHGPAATLNSR